MAMTAKQKALQLLSRFDYQLKFNCQSSTVYRVAIECSLIAVEEVLSVLVVSHTIEGDRKIDYWQEVKNELLKLK